MKENQKKKVFNEEYDTEMKELLTEAGSNLKKAGMSKEDTEILLLVLIRKAHLKQMVRYLREHPEATPDEIEITAERIATSAL